MRTMLSDLFVARLVHRAKTLRLTARNGRLGFNINNHIQSTRPCINSTSDNNDGIIVLYHIHIAPIAPIVFDSQHHDAWNQSVSTWQDSHPI